MSTNDEPKVVQNLNDTSYEEQMQFIISKNLELDLEEIDEDLEDYYQSI